MEVPACVIIQADEKKVKKITRLNWHGMKLTSSQKDWMNIKRILGTPYEYNSNRSSTATFDCSDFVRRAYYGATGKWIPGNSRTQADFVRANGKVTTNWRNLKRGDLMFFADPATGRINHVAIYIGNEQILHATSTNGVNVQQMNNYYNTRFSFG